MVGARLDQLNDDVEPAGHLVKARYMPNQKLVTSVDEPGTAHHQLLNTELDLAGGAVVVADLHSALPAIIAGARCPLVDEDPSQAPLPKNRLCYERRRRTATALFAQRFWVKTGRLASWERGHRTVLGRRFRGSLAT